jgi:hypothetical protein
MFHTAHDAIGQAVLVADGERLHVGNIGSRQGDGVRFTMEEPAAYVQINMTNPLRETYSSDPSPQPSVILRARGGLEGLSGQELGRVQIQGTLEDGLKVTPDFSSLGDSSSVVQILNQGILVGEVLARKGSAAGLPQWPSSFGHLGADGFQIRWDTPINIMLPGQLTEVTGDELRIRPETGEIPVEFVDGFDLETSGIQPYTIAREVLGSLLNPRFEAINRVGQAVEMQFRAEFGHHYNLEQLNALGPNQLPAQTVGTVFGEGSSQEVLVPLDGAQGYFRLRVD